MTCGTKSPLRATRVSVVALCAFTAWCAVAQTNASQDAGSPAVPAVASESLPAGPLPARLLECEGNGPCNGAWKFDGSNGTAVWFVQTPIRARLTIISAAADDIVIRRTNLTDGNSAVYHGQRNGDMYSGAVVWSTPNHPGSSSGHWTASVPETNCDSGLSSAEAKRIGQNALMFDLQRAAFDCYIVAAQDGDPMAQTAVGLLYYRGRTGQVEQNYEQALPWLRKAADSGVYAAQRTVSDMYALGQGAPKDPELAKFYGDKAAEQKRDRQRQEDRADRAADRTVNAMTGFVMGTVFGAMLF
jgi:hypothetical protein